MKVWCMNCTISYLAWFEEEKVKGKMRGVVVLDLYHLTPRSGVI